MEDEILYIDENGNKISSEEISSHIGLSKLILDKNEELKNEYEKSGKSDMCDFLVMDKGYLKVSKIGNYYKVVSYASSKVSDKQRRVLAYYAEEGYALDNLTNINKMYSYDER